MLQRVNTRWRRRACAVAIGAAVASWSGFAPPAGANSARHFEKVSPADKGQGDIVADGLTTVASSSGNGVVFNSRTPFGDTIGSGVSGQTQYLARRTDGVWSTHSITPTPQPDAYQTFFAPTRLQNFSADLSAAVVTAYDLPGASDDTPLRNNIYVEDTATRGLRAASVSQQDPLTIFDFLDPAIWGISADAQHLAFVTATQMLPDAAPGVPNVYRWDPDSGLSLVGILPGERTAPPGGSDVVPAAYRGAMSADGTRQLFSAASPSGGPTQLYQRIGTARTVWISQPEGTDQSDPVNVSLQAATPDGHNVFFVTDSALLDADTSPGPDLYRYTDSANPSSDANLTLISHTGDVPGDLSGASVVGVSDDGQRAYYQTSANELMVWDHGTTRLVSRSVLRASDATEQLSATASRPGLGRVTPDGMFVAFVFAGVPDQLQRLPGQDSNGHSEMYLYSLRDDTLLCASCPSGTATTDVRIRPATANPDDTSVTRGDPQLSDLGIRPRFLSDGGRVFFSTGDALVPEDVNGVFDAYEYDPATGKVSLLSSGTGKTSTVFADASSSGDDVFLLTRQRLVTDDRDNLVDLYDVRVGPAPPTPPATDVPACDGEGCQPPLTASPSEDALGSLFLDGPGSDAVLPRTITAPQRVVLQGAAGVLKVRASGAGRLRWSARGLRSGSIRRRRGGTYQLHLRLNRNARKQLKRSGSYTTAVHLTFIASGGNQVKRTTRVTFSAPAKKGR